MKKKGKNTKAIMFLSAGFVCLMLAISMVLFLGEKSDAVYVDSQNAQMDEPYKLDEMDIDKAEIPISKIMFNWSITHELEDPEMLTSDELRELAKGQDLPDGQVPEPATAALLIAGGIGLVSRARRKRG